MNATFIPLARAGAATAAIGCGTIYRALQQVS